MTEVWAKMDNLYKDIEKLKLNQATTSKAKWIINEYEYLDCSNCGDSYYTGMDSMAQAVQNLNDREVPNYCPNCGAKMGV